MDGEYDEAEDEDDDADSALLDVEFASSAMVESRAEALMTGTNEMNSYLPVSEYSASLLGLSPVA